MRKVKKIIAFLMVFACLFSVACGRKTPDSTHKCVFDKEIAEENFLCASPTCVTPATYFYSCECGKAGTETFTRGEALKHDFSAEIIKPEFLKTSGDCMHESEYYKSCVRCGVRSYLQTFKTGILGAHDFSRKVKSAEYIKEEATLETPAVYYMSCICGKRGEETFEGDKLRIYSDEEKVAYTPVSLTVTLYDAENGVYGFTYNTESEPLRAVIRIRKPGGKWVEYPVRTQAASSYKKDDSPLSYYVSKAEIELQPDSTYEYDVYDKYVDVGTETVTINTKDPKAKNFTFVHMSDSQNYPSEFGDSLRYASQTGDFILHTGDVVEWSKYEQEWTEMLNGNFKYLSVMPVMAISGNHETTYRNGSDETNKHFNYKLPVQASTKSGLFYSFVYGDVKFIMLNTNDLDESELKAEQYDWLIKELEGNTCGWTVVAMHNPMYSVGKYGADSTRNGISLSLRKQLQGIFAKYRVDVVLQGHDHCVSRTYPINEKGRPEAENEIEENGITYSVNPSGVIYVMNGTAGGQTRVPYQTDDSLYKYARNSLRSSWAEFSFEDDRLTVSVRYFDGNKVGSYYTWGIKKI